MGQTLVIPRKKPPFGFDDSGRPIWAKNDKGIAICGAVRRGHLCKITSLYPNGRCHRHGGPGTGAPIVNGNRSKLWKQLGIAKHAKAAFEDPELTSHRANIATIEGLIVAEAANIEPGRLFWESATALYRRAVEDKEATIEEKRNALKELGAVLDAGRSREQSVERILGLMDQQRRHRDSESKREALVDQTISGRQAQGLITAIVVILKEEIGDSDLLSRIGRRLVRLLGETPGRAALPAGDDSGA